MYIFSTKSLIGTAIGAGVGFAIYYFCKTLLGVGKIGLILALVFAAIGFAITTLKVPETGNFSVTRVAGGEKLDDVIFRAIKFKAKGKRIYLYTKEENKK